jgi:hypothetical protein
MNENDMLKADQRLREAIRRREQKRPPMPADLNERLMQRIRQRPRHRRVWLCSAVAASVLLLLTLYINNVEQETPSAPRQLATAVRVVPKVAQAPPVVSPPAVAGQDNHAPLPPQPARKRKKRKPRHELSDTLGNGIWQSRENVERAVRMLADCEATIRREEQQVCNQIIEATFRATPQPAGVILVSNEAGDYEVIKTKSIVEI